MMALLEERGRPRFILASGSATRAAMLRASGLSFDVIPAAVDEAALSKSVVAGNPDVTPAAIAILLARAKAAEVSSRFPEALVIGGDQVLALGRDVVFKAPDYAAAKRILMTLKGRTHMLHSAAAVAQAGAVEWVAADTAQLTMRDFSAEFLDDYLARAGDALTSSAGCYQIEGLGVQLFETVSGDHATILGLPLLPLLAELRRRGVLIS